MKIEDDAGGERKSLSFDERVFAEVCLVPCGRVSTYGRIASRMGCPHGARVVGYALHRNPRPMEIPCHRIVNKVGRLAPAFAFGGAEIQRLWLEREGIRVCEDEQGLIVDNFENLVW